MSARGAGWSRARRALAVLAAPAVLAGRPSAAQTPPAAATGTHVVVIAGASGEPAYAEAFHRAALAIVDASRTRFGVDAGAVAYLGEDPARAPTRMAGRSTREQIARTLGEVAARARPGDQVWVVLIGHGSGQGPESRFNLPGPDITAREFARLLVPLARQRVAFVNAASASGDFAGALAGPGRAIVTATRSSSERNATRFARHFADALATDGADVDKSGGVSLLEAFGYAKREVARAYEAENRLLTEHAQLEDDGDGAASQDPGVTGGDGRLAATLVLGGGPPGTDPRAGPLTARTRALVDDVAALRARRATLDSATYERRLETVLVELARTSRALRALEGDRP